MLTPPSYCHLLLNFFSSNLPYTRFINSLYSWVLISQLLNGKVQRMSILIPESAIFSREREGKERGQLIPRGTVLDSMQYKPVEIVIPSVGGEKEG